MDGYELLEIVGKVAIVLANLIVLRIGLSAYRDSRLLGLILLSISSALGLFTFALNEIYLTRITDPEIYARIWVIWTLLWIVDLVLYAWGVSKLVAGLLERSATGHPHEQNSERKNR